MIEVRAVTAVFSCKTEYILQLFKQQALVTFIRGIGLFHQLSKIISKLYILLTFDFPLRRARIRQKRRSHSLLKYHSQLFPTSKRSKTQ